MAREILSIPTPPVKEYDLKTFGLASVAIGKTINRIPEPYKAIAQNVLTPPTSISDAQKLIRDFLTKIPEPQAPTDWRDYKVPERKYVNNMPELAGTALDGSPIFSNLEIQAGNWTDFSGVQKGFIDMIFNTVIITTQQQKNIVTTSIQGSDDGDVMEYSGLNNYNITINAIVLGAQNGMYPTDEMGEIVKMLTAPISIKVDSWYLQMLNIYEIVITGYDIGQSEGGISQQPITITAKSNTTSTLIIQ